MESGAAVDATLMLSGPALEGGVRVTLTNPRPELDDVPPSIIVPAGSISETLTLTARTVSQPTEVTIIAAYGDEQRPVTLLILPPPAPSNAPTVRPTNTPTISPTITSTPTNTPTPTITPTITVTPTITPTITLTPTITPTVTSRPAPRLNAFTVAPDAIEGGSGAAGTVTLSDLAPAGGFPIRLINNSQLVRMPDSVTVPGQQRSATFRITTEPVSEDTAVELSASDGERTLVAPLKVLAPTRPDLGVALADQAPDVVCSGDPVTCNVSVAFTVTNRSNTNVTNPFIVQIEADAVPLDLITINGLAAGASASFTQTLGPGGNCYDPDCTLKVIVDTGNAVLEVDEQNNTATATYNG
jgi:hypothetical protein